MSETGENSLEVQDYLQLKNFVQSSDRGTFGNDTGTNPFHGGSTLFSGISVYHDTNTTYSWN